MKEELSIFLYQHTTGISTSKPRSLSPCLEHSMQISFLCSQKWEEQQQKEAKKMKIEANIKEEGSSAGGKISLTGGE